MSFVNDVLSFVTDQKRRLSSRATVFVMSVLLLLLVDNMIGFSEYYNNTRQLEQLKSITELLKDSTLTNDARTKLVEMEKTTLGRENIFDKMIYSIGSVSWSNATESTDKSFVKEGRSDFWFLISASGLYILTTILIVPIILITDRKTPWFQLFATMILFSIIMVFTSWFNYWLFDKLIPPKLFGSWGWNYAFNIIIQVLLILFYLWIDSYAKKMKQV